VRLKAAEASKSKSVSDRRAFRIVSDEIEPLAIADLVKAKLVREAVDHSSLP
jgi:hypothetical protein